LSNGDIKGLCPFKKGLSIEITPVQNKVLMGIIRLKAIGKLGYRLKA